MIDFHHHIILIVDYNHEYQNMMMSKKLYLKAIFCCQIMKMTKTWLSSWLHVTIVPQVTLLISQGADNTVAMSFESLNRRRIQANSLYYLRDMCNVPQPKMVLLFSYYDIETQYK